MAFKHAASVDDEAFRSAFESGRMAPSEFNHRAHVRLAYAYLTRQDQEAACRSMREALLSFLRRHKLPVAKFHETMTRAWILAVRHFMERTAAAESFDRFIGACPALLDPKIMLTHYSAAVLFSDEARARFVDPDLGPLPLED